MKLPKSLRVVSDSMTRSGNGAAFVAFGRRASKWQQAQGTRGVQSHGGASASNTPDPLRPGQSLTPDRSRGWDDPAYSSGQDAAFSTDTPVRDGTEGTIIQTRDWPPNPSSESLSPSGGHKEQGGIDGDLHLGKGPGRISRGVPMRIFGTMGIATGQRGSEATIDSIADRAYMAHVPVARQAMGTKGPQKLSDDNAVIPAIYAGNPRSS